MSSHDFNGGCHCGNLTYVFEASAGLETLGLRACLCSFCRAHGARTTSDPAGKIRLSVLNPQKLLRYRFGLKTADFLICSDCGVYIGALMIEGDRAWMTLNANTFKPPPALDAAVVPHDFEAEDVAARIRRRKTRWTPVVDAPPWPAQNSRESTGIR